MGGGGVQAAICLCQKPAMTLESWDDYTLAQSWVVCLLVYQWACILSKYKSFLECTNERLVLGKGVESLLKVQGRICSQLNERVTFKIDMVSHVAKICGWFCRYRKVSSLAHWLEVIFISGTHQCLIFPKVSGDF